MRENAIKRLMAEEAASAVPMSSVDAVVITKNDGNVPGCYISSDQRLADAYGQQLIFNAAAQQQAAAQADFFQQLAHSGNERTLPIPSEHIIVIEGPPTRSVASPDGRTIINF